MENISPDGAKEFSVTPSGFHFVRMHSRGLGPCLCSNVPSGLPFFLPPLPFLPLQGEREGVFFPPPKGETLRLEGKA